MSGALLQAINITGNELSICSRKLNSRGTELKEEAGKWNLGEKMCGNLAGMTIALLPAGFTGR
jgi:hypothetical protein